jgi:NADPH:quinone reductase
VGFTGGSIPHVNVNRLLLRNAAVVGSPWRAWVIERPEAAREIGDVVTRLIGDGAIRPLVGAHFAWRTALTRCA